MAVKSEVEVFYPTSDGKPMGETELHRDWIVWVIQRLKRHFHGQRVCVSGNLLIYYVEGESSKHICPDCFVVKDCDPGTRDLFKIWEEHRVPNFIMEYTSKSTRRVDMGSKKTLYAELGVREYFLYDPTGDWLKEIIAYRLDGNEEFQRITPEADGTILSEELGVRFQLIDGILEMFDTESGQRLLREFECTEWEAQQKEFERREKEKERREKEKAQKRAAELEKEIERLQKRLEGK